MMRQFAFVLMAALWPMGALAQTDLADRLIEMEGHPCDDSNLICVTLPMPLDHAANDPDKTVPVTFAVHMAPYPRGTLVYAVGGPGMSGLVAAGSYMPSFSDDLTDNMNIVFFDQRGVGAATGLECLNALTSFDRAALPLDDPDSSIRLARQFAQDCKAEMRQPDLVPYMTTDQVIRDIELFRQKLGVGPVWIYGESYGTQVAQTYASAYPKAVEGIILDGVVDLNLSAQGFYASSTLAAEAILERLFAECDANPLCSADMGQPSAKIYDDLMARLPAKLSYPLSDGGFAERSFTAEALQNVAFYALYGQESRAEFLRALAAAAKGDLVPLQRLEYANLYLDPDTEAPLVDGSWFGAAYYAVTCGDYAEGSGDPVADARAILTEAQSWPKGRMDRTYYAERLTCAFWAPQKGVQRPDAFVGGDYPTIVLNGDADPITPASMARSVAQNARNSVLILQENGPHVIWGRGETCPDDAIAGLLLNGQMPQPPQECVVDLIWEYLPLYPADMHPLPIASAVLDELWMYPDFYGWDEATRVTTVCTGGGTVSFWPKGDYGTAFQFKACQMWPGITLNGTGTETYAGDETDGLTLKLQIQAGDDRGQIVYRSNPDDDSGAVTGTWNGQPL